MRIVVDTNIVFSALLNTESNIAKILILHHEYFSFYSCDFLREEIIRHKKKIIKITGYTSAEYNEAESLIIKNIRFINHNLIDDKILLKSKTILENIDIDDFPFFGACKTFERPPLDRG